MFILAIDCGYLAAPKNGAVKFVPDTTLRSRAKFSCDYGFKLVGSDVLTCEASGDWSDTPPTCESNETITAFHQLRAIIIIISIKNNRD